MTLRFSPSRGAASLVLSSLTRGPQGPAATVDVGSTSALAAGSTPTVTNVGTRGAAVLDFAIPRGADGGLKFTFNTSTIMASPSSGEVRFNSDTPASITQIAISAIDANSNAVRPYILLWDDSTNSVKGYIVFKKEAVGTAIVLQINGSITDNTTWLQIPVTWISGTTAFSASDPVYVRPEITGDKGTNGTVAISGTPSGGQVAQWTNSTTIQGVGQAAFLAAAPFGPFTSIASATTTDLSTVATIGVSITGTTTITGLGSGASLFRIIKFAAALTLTHNATSLILPGAANITTAAGDTALALSDASGNWTVLDYVRASGTGIGTGLTTIASATTTDLGSTLAGSITVSGTTAITSFGSTAPIGSVKHVYFSGALTLTHNGTSLILPGAANIVTAAGDCLIARHEGSGNWRVLTYLRAAGRPLSSGATDTLVSGFTATSTNGGSVTGSGQSITPTPGNVTANLQYYTLNGSSLTGTLTLNPPVSDCTVVFDLINGGSGSVGATLSTSGWTKVTGDTYATTNGNKYRCYGSVINGNKHLHITALQ